MRRLMFRDFILVFWIGPSSLQDPSILWVQISKNSMNYIEKVAFATNFKSTNIAVFGSVRKIF